jgi:hypothetical protein
MSTHSGVEDAGSTGRIVHPSEASHDLMAHSWRQRQVSRRAPLETHQFRCISVFPGAYILISRTLG